MHIPDEVAPTRNEPARTEGRRAADPTLRGALLWAVVGAALFLGVGAALPVWSVPLPAYLLGSAVHEPEVGWPAGEAMPPGWRGPLWRAAELRLDERRWPRSHGFPAPLVRIDDDFVLAPLILIPAGAGVGLLGSFAFGRLRNRKGGGA